MREGLPGYSEKNILVIKSFVGCKSQILNLMLLEAFKGQRAKLQSFKLRGKVA